MTTVTEIIECPICLDEINLTQVSNRVTTECGHTFHCNCLMQSCATMGFGCPYCRTAMATAPEEDEESENEEDEEEQEPFSDDVLRGFRFFFNNVNNEEHDHEDVLEQQEDEEEAEAEAEAVLPKPSAAFITAALVAQGVTMEQLVKILLQDHDEYEDEELEFDLIDEEVWGQMRTIISNYQPQQQDQEQPQTVEQAVEDQPQTQEPQTQVQVQAHAEAKTSAPNPQRRREFMSHV